MADFCVQCAEAMSLGTDDLAGLTSKADWAQGGAVVVLCEECGYVQVDSEGYCISKDCAHEHGRKRQGLARLQTLGGSRP